MQVCETIIKPQTAPRKCSYAELLEDPEMRGPANVLVSHAWSCLFLAELVESIGHWISQQEQEQHPASHWRFWIDIFVVSQHPPDAPPDQAAPAAAASFDVVAQGLESRLKGIGRAVFVTSPWDRPAWMRRAWCLYEFHLARRLRLPLDFAMPPAQAARFALSLGEAGPNRLLDAAARVDAATAAASSAGDEARIRAAVGAEAAGPARLRQAVLAAVREHCADAAARALARTTDEQKAASPQLLLNAAALLNDAGDADAALGHLLELLRVQAARLGPGHESLAKVYSLLGSACRRAGRPDEALGHYRQALEVCTRRFGDSDGLPVADACGDVGAALAAQGRLAEAAEMHERCLAIRRRLILMRRGFINLFIFTCLHGFLYLFARIARCLAIRRRVLGDGHEGVAAAEDNVGAALMMRGDLAGALARHRRARDARAARLGPDHPSVALAEASIGSVLSAQGDHGAAVEHFQRALAAQRAALGDAHPLVASTYNNMAGAERLRGDLGRAAELYEAALRIKAEALGPAHVQVAGGPAAAAAGCAAARCGLGSGGRDQVGGGLTPVERGRGRGRGREKREER